VLGTARSRPARRARSTRAAFVALLGAVAVGAAGGCSAALHRGPSGPPGGDKATCVLIGDLSRSGDALGRANISDPHTFDLVLAAAVRDYTAILDKIADRVPDDLRRRVLLLRSAVEQYKFADAITARAPLDDWASQHC
jgi:hypothetical protein